jgi:hypothetical protein
VEDVEKHKQKADAKNGGKEIPQGHHSDARG